jgi:hypothetical protein
MTQVWVERGRRSHGISNRVERVIEVKKRDRGKVKRSNKVEGGVRRGRRP